MKPARESFNPMALDAPGARLRTAIFPAGPNRQGAHSFRGASPNVCVLLNGQTEFIEKYFEVIDDLRRRGFAVVAMDWRGQGGSGRLVPEAPLKAHIHDFAEYDADLNALLDQIVEPLLNGRRPIALSHSMGGHILLRHLSRQPGRFAAAAFCAPMVMFSTRGQPRWLVRLLTEGMTSCGHATDFVWGMAGRDPLTMDFRDQIVTSDRERFQRTQDFLMAHPDLRLAGPTWGWTAAAFRSIARSRQVGYAERIITPALICGAEHDRICVTEETRRFATRMPHAIYLPITGAEHEILMERDVFRSRFWNGFDKFMREYL
jgi:lysophospholipase